MEKGSANVITSWNQERLTRIALYLAVRALPALERTVFLNEGALLREHPETLCDLIQNLSSEEFRERAEQLLERCDHSGIKIVLLGDSAFPERMYEISDYPPILFARGTWPNSHSRFISVVGSRKADTFGCNFAAETAELMASSGVVVVSGLALGIDGSAHRGALRAKGDHPGIAVLGGGLNQLYPRAHFRLAQELVDRGGLLLSQFDPDERPYPSHFVNRNRLIAGLSEATIVVQAGEKSGALVTARRAAEYGRDVFVVPGDVRNPLYRGSLKLLQEGAYPVGTSQEVIELLSIQANVPPQEPPISECSSSRDKEVLALLSQKRECSPAHLAELLGVREEEYHLLLLKLELEGKLSIGPGGSPVIL